MLVFSLMHNGLKNILNQSTFNTGFFHAKCDFFQWEQNLPCGREFVLIVMQNNEKKKYLRKGSSVYVLAKMAGTPLDTNSCIVLGMGPIFPRFFMRCLTYA
jgi:hypothetical protein